MAGVVEAVEATLEQAGLHQSGIHPPAMCFLDVSGYTELTEEQGDAAAAEVSTRLGELVRRGSSTKPADPCKSLGDGVMVHFKEPAKAVGFALEMRDAVPTVGLPPLHVGIAAGALIYQSGDYFGRTVTSPRASPRTRPPTRSWSTTRRPWRPRRRCGVRRDRACGAEGGRAARPTVGSSPPLLIRLHARVGHVHWARVGRCADGRSTGFAGIRGPAWGRLVRPVVRAHRQDRRGPHDDEDLRNKKALLVLLAVLILPVSVVWGSSYLAFGSLLGILPFIYFSISVASLVFFAKDATEMLK